MLQKDLFKTLNENTNLIEIQSYVKEVISLRGFGCQAVQESMLLLLEGTGLLVKTVNKSVIVSGVTGHGVNSKNPAAGVRAASESFLIKKFPYDKITISNTFPIPNVL